MTTEAITPTPAKSENESRSTRDNWMDLSTPNIAFAMALKFSITANGEITLITLCASPVPVETAGVGFNSATGWIEVMI